jgi:hypothetical protein
MSDKPKWIPGPPTTTGWHWFKFNTIIGNLNSIYEVKKLEKTYFLTYQNVVIHFDKIVSHSPISEPEE